MSAEYRTALLANEVELTAACGDALPESSDAIIAAADKAVEAASNHNAADRDDAGPSWTAGLHPSMLPNLAVAYRHTKDAKYAAAARSIYDHWLKKEPLVDGQWIPPDYYNTLLIPHRLGDTECIGWFGALPAFLSDEQFDDDLVTQLVHSAAGQLNHLAKGLHEARNIRMSQADGLWTQGFRLSFLKDAERWRDLGLRAINDAFNRLVNEDGSSREATGWYHFIVMNMAFRYWRLSQAMPDMHMPLPADLVARMFEFTLASMGPDGYLNRIGDCTARVTTGNKLQHMLDYRAAACAVLEQVEVPLPHRQYFQGAGQAVLRDSWSDEASCITFDATTREGYHWHAARNAIQIYVAGKRIIADPGRMGYADNISRRSAISTASHSTINFNGWNQIASTPVTRVRGEGDYDIVDSQYDGGYWPGHENHIGRAVFGEHHRTVMWIRGRMIVVLDHAQHREHEGCKPTLEWNWQFTQGAIDLSTAGSGSSSSADDKAAARIHADRDGSQLLMLAALTPEGMSPTVLEGSEDPPRGWVANLGDKGEPAPLVRFAAEGIDPWDLDLAAAFIPGADRDAAWHVIESQAPTKHTPGRIVIRDPDGAVDEIWWSRQLRRAIEKCGDFVTDASLVHLHRDPTGSVVRAMVCDGSTFGRDDRQRRPRPTTYILDSPQP